MRITILNENIVSRCYENMNVLYNDRTKEMLLLNDVASDIWEYINLNKEKSITEIDIEQYISKIYKIDIEMISSDVIDFLYNLFENGLVCIDNQICIKDKNDSDMLEQEDVEGKIIQIMQKNNQLYSATFELTYLCNEKCVHCYRGVIDDNDNKRQLDVIKCKSLIDELYEMKCFHLSFTGGDPFLFRGFLELLEYVKKKKFVFDIFTNGLYLFENEYALNKIIELNPRRVLFSIYGANSKTHDNITKLNGSFYKTLEVIKKLRDKGVTVILNVMLLNNNIKEIDQIIKFIKELNVEYRVGMSIIKKNDGGIEPLKYFINDKLVMRNIIKKLFDKGIYNVNVPINKNKGDLICGAGVASMCISPNGEVYPCVSLKKILGSVWLQSLKEIWYSPVRKEYANKLKWENTEKCLECKYNKYCPHCIGISNSESGNLFSCNNCDYLIAEAMWNVEMDK